jgi:Uri superfamily endonuclease
VGVAGYASIRRPNKRWHTDHSLRSRRVNRAFAIRVRMEE